MEGPPATCAPPIQAIAACLRARPELCALRFHELAITNGDLLHSIAHALTALRDAGVGYGTRIGLCLERGPDAVVLLLAAWWLGAVYVPLDPALPRERLFAMCMAARLDLVVATSATRPLAERLPCALLLREPATFHAKEPHAAPALPAPVPGSGDLAYILFTSGSSGTPKGVRICHGHLAALLAAVQPLLQLTEGCRILGCASFSFDISLFELLAPLLRGGTLVLADAAACSSPVQLLQLIEREDLALVMATPSHWQLLTSLTWTKAVPVAIATGEALSRATAATILRHAGTLWNFYGPTECTIWCSAHRVSAEDLLDTAPPIVCIGKALPGYQLELMPSQGEAGAHAAGTGVLLITGRGVGLGYCDARDTATAFTALPEAGARSYRTGDVCRRDGAGRFHYLGRGDSQVKHNGYRIELDEIVLCLERHMSVRQAACVVRPMSASRPSLLCACVAFRAGMPNRDKTALNRYLADYLPAWMLPQRYCFVEQLPLTPQGKLDRAALLALTEPVCEERAGGSLEARVAAVFREVLDLDRIGPCDSFLDLGGSSMLVATLVLTLNERLGSALSLRQALATPPTVSSIVQLLRAQQASNPST